MFNSRKIACFALAIASLTSIYPLNVAAQDKPTIKILVGFPPGGSVDIVARLVAEKLRASLNQNFIVENKPGAGGRIALAEIKRANPDGQTLILAPYSGLVIFPHIYKNLGYDAAKDFTPISRVATFEFALTAGSAAPQGDLKAVVAWMKANPVKANYATSGVGTAMHFTGLLFAQTAGIQLNHVAYKGGAPAVQDLMGGVIPLMIDTPSETLEQHKAGKLQILATTGEKRAKVLPDVPTLKEAGFNVAAEGYFGLYGPARLPANEVTRLNKALAEALGKPDIQDRLIGLGLTANHAGPEELASMQAADLKRWGAPVKASGFTAD